MQTSALPANLPSQLLQVLNELDVAPHAHGQPAGGDFWLRLATQLETLEEVAAVLPEDVSVGDLASWLAAGLGGDGLPEDGKELPLPAGFVLDPARVSQEQVQDAAAAYQARLLAAAVHVATAGHQAVGGELAATEQMDADAFTLRARLGELLAELRPTPVIQAPDARPIVAAALPSALLGGQAAETAAAPPLNGIPAVGGAEPRLSDLLPLGTLPAAGSADAGPGRGPLEAGALSVRITEATAQPAALAGVAAPSVDSPAGNQPGSANTLTPRLFNLDIPLQQPGWDRAFGNGVRWMVNQNVQVAELRLSPPSLGPLEVRLQVEGDRTHVNIVAPHATTREAVEAALPRLREMFAESGLNLGNVNVRQDSPGHGGTAGGERPGQASSATAGAPDERDTLDSRAGPVTAQGLVDFYA
jgi:hypothetical protein